MKLKYIVVYENSSDELDIEHHRIKVKVTASEGCIFGSWALYLSFGTCYEVNIRQLVLLVFIKEYVNITTLE